MFQSNGWSRLDSGRDKNVLSVLGDSRTCKPNWMGWLKIGPSTKQLLMSMQTLGIIGHGNNAGPKSKTSNSCLLLHVISLLLSVWCFQQVECSSATKRQLTLRSLRTAPFPYNCCMTRKRNGHMQYDCLRISKYNVNTIDADAMRIKRCGIAMRIECASKFKVFFSITLKVQNNMYGKGVHRR